MDARKEEKTGEEIYQGVVERDKEAGMALTCGGKFKAGEDNEFRRTEVVGGIEKREGTTSMKKNLLRKE